MRGDGLNCHQIEGMVEQTKRRRRIISHRYLVSGFMPVCIALPTLVKILCSLAKQYPPAFFGMHSLIIQGNTSVCGIYSRITREAAKHPHSFWLSTLADSIQLVEVSPSDRTIWVLLQTSSSDPLRYSCYPFTVLEYHICWWHMCSIQVFDCIRKQDPQCFSVPWISKSCWRTCFRVSCGHDRKHDWHQTSRFSAIHDW